MLAMMDFKARLYNSYSSEHVQVTPGQLQSALAARAPYSRAILKKWVPSNRATRILDIGCGYGALLYFLRENGYTNLSGVDVSPEQVELAHLLGLKQVACGQIRDSLAQIPEASLDVVFAFDVLEHVTRPELLELGDLIYRVLAPGGKLIVHVPNASAIFSGIIRYGDLTHELAFTQNSLRQFGNACRLKMFAVEEDQPVPHGIVSAARWIVWNVGTFPLRILMMAESPRPFGEIILSQNLRCMFAK